MLCCELVSMHGVPRRHWMLYRCHTAVHKAEPNAKLADGYHTIELIMGHPQVAAYAFVVICKYFTHKYAQLFQER